MDNHQKKQLIRSAISGIETIIDVSNLAGIPLTKTLNAESLKLWADVIAALHEEMSGEEMGIMFALILDVANRGNTISEVKNIRMIDIGDQFAMQVELKTRPEHATTIH